MKFIIVPKEVHDTISIEVLKEHGIDHPRISVDGTEVMLHVEHYDTLFPPVLLTSEDGEINDITREFPVYVNPSDEFNSIITSDKWSSSDILTV